MSVFGSNRAVADVSLDLRVECVDDHGMRHELDVVLGYHRNDPYAVTMTFATAEGELVWTFGRDLLAHGVSVPTGQGDVHVAPAIGVNGRPTVQIELSSPDGHLVLEARGQDLRAFLAKCSSVVPAGAESDQIDVDDLIARLLSS